MAVQPHGILADELARIDGAYKEHKRAAARSLDQRNALIRQALNQQDLTPDGIMKLTGLSRRMVYKIWGREL